MWQAIKSLLPPAATLILLAWPAGSLRADDVAQFYTGKTVTIVVSVEVGGLYSTFATIFARHLGGHIPGKPQVIVQHMPGAGGSIAVNWGYNVAPKDGTLIISPNTGLPLRVPLGLDKPTYDAAKFTWIGGWNEGVNTVTLRRDIAPVTTLEGARQHEVILGAIGRSSNTYTVPALLNNMLGTRFKLITGYRGGSPIRLAMEKGEVQGWAGQYDGWKLIDHPWVKDGNLVHLVQLASKPAPGIPHVPLLSSFARDGEERAILKAIESGIADRAFIVPPGVPEPRVKALTMAYENTLRNPQFLKDAAAARFDIDPIPAPTIQAYIASVAALPPATIAKIKRAMELE
jgi:tripartite-type tricarboxylate transporter receptor subunit TctC